MPAPIQIAFACDDGYARHVAVVMRSIFTHAHPDDRHEFHVLTMGLTTETESRLYEVANDGGASLEIHHVDRSRLEGFPEKSHTLNTYLRILLPELLPVTPRILYLDADLLVFSSLAELWQLDLSGAIMAAATDASYLFGGISLAHFQRLGLHPSNRYFSAGVLLMNLNKWSEGDATSLIRSWASEYSQLMTHSDQDALNVILAGQVMPLHLRWNLQVPLIEPVKYGWNCTREMAEAVAQPGIVHYTGSAKPWHREYPAPYQNLYFHYLAETPWKGQLPPPMTIAQRLRRTGRLAKACYMWARSEARRWLGRHPAPTEEIIR